MMEARKFNSIMPAVNEKWAARVLGLERNGSGADLSGAKCVVEVKFSISKKNYPRIWTIMDYQTDYSKEDPTKNAYWALGEYHLDREVSEIKTESQKKLESFVLDRELWVVAWDWINQFPPSETSGETDISKWKNTFRYARKDKNTSRN